MGVGGERPRGHELPPTWLQSSQQGSWGGCKRGGGPAPGPAAGGGGLEAGSSVCAPTPPPPLHLSPAKWPDLSWVPQRRCSLPGEKKEAHIPPHGQGMCQTAARAGCGFLLCIPSHHSPGSGGSRVGRSRGKDIADPGKLKLRPDGSAPSHCLDHKCPFLV